MDSKEKPFAPVIAPHEKKREFSLKAILLGVILGLVFGVGNAYLGLKVGITISASIPAAVMSMAILRAFFKDVTILENNIVQTIAAVGEGLAAGIIFTVPALFLLGDHPSKFRIFLLALLGGILGILFMIPMRRYIIVKEHGILPFPEGTACAEILKAGKRIQSNAAMAWIGLAVGIVYKLCIDVFALWRERVSLIFPSLHKAELSVDCTPALLGVGFIIGPRIASVMFCGGIIGWWVLIPLIRVFGQGNVTIFPAMDPISALSTEEIWSNYIRYIGAGAVAMGGLISLVRIFPVILKTVHVGFKELFEGANPHGSLPRTDRDISMRWLILGSLAIILFLWLYPPFHINLLALILIIILGYFFVAVTSITVGLVGSSSNPVSGMTITLLLIISLIFLSLGWTERIFLISAITASAVANVAISLAATTSQDLKTGYILGATPWKQQVAEMIGLILPALAVGATLYLLNDAYTFGSTALPAPQATLMALIAKGVIQGQLPFGLVGIGLILGFLVYLLRVPILPFAIGLYLPLSLSTGIMVGGIVSGIVKKVSNKNSIEQGVLLGSGLVAGDACTGVVIAALTVFGVIGMNGKSLIGPEVSLLIYFLLAAGFGWLSTYRSKQR